MSFKPTPITPLRTGRCGWALQLERWFASVHLDQLTRRVTNGGGSAIPQRFTLAAVPALSASPTVEPTAAPSFGWPSWLAPLPEPLLVALGVDRKGIYSHHAVWPAGPTPSGRESRTLIGPHRRVLSGILRWTSTSYSFIDAWCQRLDDQQWVLPDDSSPLVFTDQQWAPTNYAVAQVFPDSREALAALVAHDASPRTGALIYGLFEVADVEPTERTLFALAHPEHARQSAGFFRTHAS